MTSFAGHLPVLTGKSELVDCQKASMRGAHSCSDLVDVNTSHTPERSPTATVAKLAHYHHHHRLVSYLCKLTGTCGAGSGAP